jgi:RNA polymerase sigma-70 factor (ECF subfamily)
MPLETPSSSVLPRRVGTTSASGATASPSLSPENVAAAQEGSRVAQSLLAEAIRPLIERQLARYPLTEEDRHDVLQSTQMQVIRRLSSFRGNSSFTTWLFRVTANEALMLMRSQRRLRARVTAGVDFDDLSLPPEAVTAAGDLDASMLDNEREGSVRSAVAQLPEHYQAVVSAHYVDDLGLQEIALRLSLTESAVRSRLHRARARLRDLLGPVVGEMEENGFVPSSAESASDDLTHAA